MEKNLLVEGDKVDVEEIVKSKNSDNIEKRIFKTMIYEVNQENIVTMYMPMEQGKIRLLELNSIYKFIFYTSRGLFACKGKVIQRSKKDGHFLICVAIVGEMVKHQRREFYRMDCLLDINCVTINAEEAEEIVGKVDPDIVFVSNKEKSFKAIALDISGGGIRFISEKSFDKNDYIMVDINLSSDEENNFKCFSQVVASERQKNNPINFETRIKFIIENPKDRERIIHYIFEVERKIRNSNRNKK